MHYGLLRRLQQQQCWGRAGLHNGVWHCHWERVQHGVWAELPDCHWTRLQQVRSSGVQDSDRAGVPDCHWSLYTRHGAAVQHCTGATVPDRRPGGVSGQPIFEQFPLFLSKAYFLTAQGEELVSSPLRCSFPATEYSSSEVQNLAYNKQQFTAGRGADNNYYTAIIVRPLGAHYVPTHPPDHLLISYRDTAAPPPCRQHVIIMP